MAKKKKETPDAVEGREVGQDDLIEHQAHDSRRAPAEAGGGSGPENGEPEEVADREVQVVHDTRSI
jgi:hypothetical protein